MKREQAIKALTNYFRSLDVNTTDINALFAKKAVDFLYETEIMRPVKVEQKSIGCMHSMWESCNCGYGETIVYTEWSK